MLWKIGSSAETSYRSPSIALSPKQARANNVATIVQSMMDLYLSNNENVRRNVVQKLERNLTQFVLDNEFKFKGFYDHLTYIRGEIDQLGQILNQTWFNLDVLNSVMLHKQQELINSDNMALLDAVERTILSLGTYKSMMSHIGSCLINLRGELDIALTSFCNMALVLSANTNYKVTNTEMQKILVTIEQGLQNKLSTVSALKLNVNLMVDNIRNIERQIRDIIKDCGDC